MRSSFLSGKHMENYLDLVMEDQMCTGDVERASLFYIISGNDDLYRKRRFIYDPKDHSIKRCLDNTDVDFSSSIKALIRLGFNLYNGWSDEYTTPVNLLGCLDDNNRKLARNALQIRFDSSFYYGMLE
ncbi:MAG TPA: DUF6075 family protein [Mobilitalea sp.]|nr:DUF6075 family protein [Mobilitalea sp.]